MHNSNNQNLTGGHQAQQSPGRDFYGAREDGKGYNIRSRQGLNHQEDVSAEMMGQSGSRAAYQGEFYGDKVEKLENTRLSGGRNSQSSLSQTKLQTANPQADQIAQAYLNRRKANNSRRSKNSRLSRHSGDNSQYSNNQSAARMQLQANKSQQKLDHGASVEYNDIQGSKEDLHNTSIVSVAHESKKVVTGALDIMNIKEGGGYIGARRKSAGILTQTRPSKHIREYAQVTPKQREDVLQNTDMDHTKQKILSKINCQNPYVVRKPDQHASSTINTATLDNGDELLNQIEFKAYTPATIEGHNDSLLGDDHVNYASVNHKDMAQYSQITPQRHYKSKNPYIDNNFEPRSSQKKRFLDNQEKLAQKSLNIRSVGRSSGKRSKSGRGSKRQDKYLKSLLQEETESQIERQEAQLQAMDELRNQNQTLPVEQIESFEIRQQTADDKQTESSSSENDQISEESQGRKMNENARQEVLKKKTKKKKVRKSKKDPNQAEKSPPKYSKNSPSPKKSSMAVARNSPKKGFQDFNRKMAQSVMGQDYMMSQMSPQKKSPKKQRNNENGLRKSMGAYANDDLIDVNDQLQIFDRNFQSTLKSSNKNSPLKSTMSFSHKKQLKQSPLKKDKREPSPSRKKKDQIKTQISKKEMSPDLYQRKIPERKKCTSSSSSKSSETSQTAPVTKQKIGIKKSGQNKRAVRKEQPFKDDDSEGDLSVSATIEATHHLPHTESFDQKSQEGDETMIQDGGIEASNSSNTSPSKQESSDKKIKSIRFKKDLIALKLNQRLKKLNSQKQYGDQQFERAKVQLKDFYRQIRKKVDEQEAKSSNELRGNLFIRQQNFSRMVNQVQFQLDQLKSQLEPTEFNATGKSFLSQTQTFEFTKNNAEQVIYQADAFLGVEKGLVKHNTSKTSDQNLFDQDDLHESSQEEQKPVNMLNFPNYTSEVLAKLIKVEFIPKLNCEKFDFINQTQTNVYSSNQKSQSSTGKYLNFTIDKGEFNGTMSSMNTQKLNQMIKTPSSKHQSPSKPPSTLKKNSVLEDSHKKQKKFSEKQQSNRNNESSSDETSYSGDESRQNTIQPSKSQVMSSNKKKKAIIDVIKKQPLIDNYQINIESSETNKNFQSNNSAASPKKMVTNGPINFKSVMNLSPKKASKTNGDLIQDLDFDLDQKLLEALKKHKKDDRKLDRDLIQNKNLKQKLLTNKSMLSIQNHIQRIQTTSSMETLERNGAGGSVLGSSQLINHSLNQSALNQSKSMVKDMKIGGPPALGGFLQPPLLSNMKYHPGHTFGKSDLNSRRAPIEKTESQGPKGVSTSFIMPDQNSQQRNYFASTALINNSKKQEINKHSPSKSPQRRQDKVNLNKSLSKSTSQDQIQAFKNTLAEFNKSPKKKSPRKSPKKQRKEAEKKALRTDRDDDEGSSHPYWKSSKHRHAKSISDYNLSRVVGGKPSKSLKQNDDLIDVAQESTSKNDFKHKRRTSRIPSLSHHANDQNNQINNQSINKTLNKSTYNENTRIPQIIKSSQVVRREGSVHSFQSNQDILNTSNSNKFNIDKARANMLQQKAAANKVTKNIIQKEDKKTLKQQNSEETNKNNKKDQKNKQVILMTAASPDEQGLLNLPDEQHTRQRTFTKIISQADRVQFQWSHPNSDEAKSLNDLQYILEYGCGIKFRGVEQFRKIYQGKAHKCIVADLMPKTTYRFRVKPVQIDQSSGQTQIIEQGEWSEIEGVTTLEA